MLEKGAWGGDQLVCRLCGAIACHEREYSSRRSVSMMRLTFAVGIHEPEIPDIRSAPHGLLAGERHEGSVRREQRTVFAAASSSGQRGCTASSEVAQK